MIKYSLNDFNNINKNNISKIDQKILLIIESLSKKVGAVSYNKTPIFKKQWKQSYVHGISKGTMLIQVLSTITMTSMNRRGWDVRHAGICSSSFSFVCGIVSCRAVSYMYVHGHK